MRNLGQSDSNLLANHIYTKMVIVSAINIDLFRRQYDVVVQLARRSPEQLSYYKDVSFGHLPLLNCENFACLSDKLVQSN